MAAMGQRAGGWGLWRERIGPWRIRGLVRANGQMAWGFFGLAVDGILHPDWRPAISVAIQPRLAVLSTRAFGQDGRMAAGGTCYRFHSQCHQIWPQAYRLKSDLYVGVLWLSLLLVRWRPGLHGQAPMAPSVREALLR